MTADESGRSAENGHACDAPRCDGTRLGHDLAVDFPEETREVDEALDSLRRSAEKAGPSCTCELVTPPFDWSCPSHGQEAVDEWSALREKRCVFCLIVAGDSGAVMVEEGERHIAFVPLGPHVEGHVLFVPRDHVPDATTNPTAAALVFEQAARYVRDLGVQANIVTSIGPQATQSVPHLHVHVVPRWPRDGLARQWPWLPNPPGTPTSDGVDR